MRQPVRSTLAVAAAFVIVGCANIERDNSMTRTQQTTMQSEANKQLVKRFFEDFSAGRFDDAFSLVHEDVRWWVPGTLPFSGTKTKTEYLKVVAAIRAGFPQGLRLVPSEMTAQGNRVAAEVESFGEHSNGKSYRNKYHFLIYVENGRFVQVKEYMDTQHLKDLISP